MNLRPCKVRTERSGVYTSVDERYCLSVCGEQHSDDFAKCQPKYHERKKRLEANEANTLDYLTQKP